MCERESKVYVFGLVLRGESDRKKSRLCPGSFAHEKLWAGLDIVIRQRKGSGIRHHLLLLKSSMDLPGSEANLYSFHACAISTL